MSSTIIICLIICVNFALSPSSSSSYTAAVYEHRVVLNPQPHLNLSRAAALRHMKTNLDVYEEQAQQAAAQGVQILVFPEDGIHGFNFSRASISSYLETIPDPQQETWNPCTEPRRYNDTEVLQRLSCMARRYSLYLVANMAGLQPCSAEIITFDTPFAGRFGVLTCFDLLFHEPTITLLERGVRQLVFPTAWMNYLPLLAAAQFQRAFSLGATGVTILAANIRNDELGMTGSGIFTPAATLGHHHARKGEPEEGRLLVARVPVLDPLWSGGAEEEVVAARESGGGGDLSSSPSVQDEKGVDGAITPPPSAPPPLLPVTSSSPTFNSSMLCDPFTFALLPAAAEGRLNVCQGPLCCHLEYRRSRPGGDGELYALGAFAGMHTVCALVRCRGPEASSCGQEVEEAETRMDFLLSGKFETPHVYPSLVVSGVKMEQPRRLERTTVGTVTMAHSNMTAGLVAASLYGRMYHLDKV
ncbi:hypothetical protein CRUP_023502 [Coryphaenoides rupestris]|nr:hypothetical protein CRUP_023502 [Coryphaenoides rupestris]